MNNDSFVFHITNENYLILICEYYVSAQLVLYFIPIIHIDNAHSHKKNC